MAAPHAFLDVLANVQIRDAYLAGRISIILSSDLETILWTNGAGAHFMGMRTVAETIGVDSGFDRLTRHQIEAGLASPKPVRVSGMPQSEFFLVNATHLAPLGDVVFLRSVEGKTDAQGGVDLIEGLSDETTAAAVFDLNGHALRASSNFDENWFDPQELRLILRQSHQEQRVKKRLLQKNPSQAIGVLALSHDPAIFLLIAAKPEKEQANGQVADEKFLFDPARLPLYFGWRVDADGCFEEVSFELEQAVGKQYADIVGKNFAEIASAWQMDSEGTLRALFTSHNAWGGIKIAWPVERPVEEPAGASDFRVAVTFFALPLYSRAREFIGFRGFARIDEMKENEPAGIMPAASQTSASGLSPQEYEAFSIIADTLTANLQQQEQKEQAQAVTPITQLQSRVQSGPQSGGVPEVETKTTPSDLAAQLRHFSPTLLQFVQPVTPVFGAIKQADSDLMAKADPLPDLRSSEMPLLQLIQLGVLIYRDEEILFVNDHLLHLTGLPTLQAFRDHGVLTSILRDWMPKNILQHVDGKKLPLRGVMRAVSWIDGEAASMIFFLPDDERHASHLASHLGEELRHVRNQAIELSTLLNLVSDGVVIVDAQGIIHSLNDGAARLFRQSADIIRGQMFKQFFAPESHEVLSRNFARLCQRQEEKNAQEPIIVRAHDGDEGLRLFEVRFAAMEVDEGYFLLLRDVSDRHHLLKQVRQSQQYQEEIKQTSHRVLAQINHQIRTPLTAIVGLSQLVLAEKYGPLNNDRYRAYLRDIASSGEHIMRLLQHLDESASAPAERARFDIKRLALNPILNEVLAKIAPQINERRIIMRTSMAVDLAHILADSHACRQIMLGLLLHALHVSEAGGQMIVSVQNVAPEGVLFRLRNSGAGLSASELKTIAQAEPVLDFVWQEWGEKDAHALSDLGRDFASSTTVLAQVKKLAEANGARFHLHSEPGKGILVDITFALA